MINGLISTSLDTIILATFMSSIVLLTGGLIAFFFEVSLATASLKINVSKVQKLTKNK
jgi:hypothetical protein